MTTIRQGEQGQAPTNRSERFFRQEGYWYYTTREGVNIGPFDSRGDAIAGCDDFVDLVANDEELSMTLQQYRARVA